jgi:hypothetical protein
MERLLRLGEKGIADGRTSLREHPSQKSVNKIIRLVEKSFPIAFSIKDLTLVL